MTSSCCRRSAADALLPTLCCRRSAATFCCRRSAADALLPTFCCRQSTHCFHPKLKICSFNILMCYKGAYYSKKGTLTRSVGLQIFFTELSWLPSQAYKILDQSDVGKYVFQTPNFSQNDVSIPIVYLLPSFDKNMYRYMPHRMASLTEWPNL